MKPWTNQANSLLSACALSIATLTVGCAGTTQSPTTPAASKTCPGAVVRGDAELERLSGCSAVRGDLSISSVESLEALSLLTEVHGALIISDNPDLTHLDGLERLSHVDTLVIRRNGLFTVKGLDGLRHVKRLAVVDNPRLISLAGLNGLREASEVVLDANPRLSAYYGLLPALEHNSVHVTVRGNRGLSAEEQNALANTRVVGMTAQLDQGR
jgi:hypothetical protein